MLMKASIGRGDGKKSIPRIFGGGIDVPNNDINGALAEEIRMRCVEDSLTGKIPSAHGNGGLVLVENEREFAHLDALGGL